MIPTTPRPVYMKPKNIFKMVEKPCQCLNCSTIKKIMVPLYDKNGKPNGEYIEMSQQFYTDMTNKFKDKN